VEGPACEFKENQGLLKKNSSAGPWIFDPTADEAVDRAMNPAHESTVDRTEGVRPDYITAARARSDGPELVRAGRGGEHAGGKSGAAALHRCNLGKRLPAIFSSAARCKA
jgi:hypothetical protein